MNSLANVTGLAAAEHDPAKPLVASEGLIELAGPVFQTVFEASTDAISIFDPLTRKNVACNEATVKLIGGPSKEWFLSQPVETLSPERQPDGRLSKDVGAMWVQRAVSEGPQRFEWVAKRTDGQEIPTELLLTPMRLGGRLFLVTVSRDIAERKKAEQALLELNQSLEMRVAERTAALSTSEARFRALVEHAPEAIVVYSVETGRFLFGNQHACDLYGVPMSKLAKLTPMDVSPEFQPGGRRTSDLAHEKTQEVLSGGISTFEWVHRRPDGQLIPTEVRLLRLPGQNLIRASIIDLTEGKRAERALRDSEAKFRALFEGTSNGVVLMDEVKLLEVNPAAVRILGRQSAQEMVGKHPSEFSPALQPNGVSSEIMAQRYIEECLAKGSARLEWLCSAPDGREIPLEVVLTRIEWSGRQVIQAFITDITERKCAQAALAESEARFSAAFQAGPILTGISRMSDGAFILVNDAFVNWSGYSQEEILGQNTAELRFWESAEDRAAFWAEVRRAGAVRERECRVRNRDGKSFILLLSSKVIELNGAPHLLSMALDITRRKQAEAELLASEARLRESESRFNIAFQASPVFINILRVSDRKYVWANDAFVNRLGYSREEVIGRTSAEFGMWESSTERDQAWKDMQIAGSIRQREVRWLTRHGEPFTILLSAEIIKFNDAPHILSMALDITQRKRAEIELLKTLEREKELSQLKSNFVSMVSHEFRTPLGIIQSSAELLCDFFQRMQPAEREEQLASIIRNTRRMAGMMEEVLVLSRLDAGGLDFRPATLDVGAFCRRVVDEVLSATHRRCTVNLTIKPLASGARADERLLGHIFTNLLTNAVKYSEPGATVEFILEQKGNDLLGTILDRGVGMSEEDQKKLFTAFHRGSNVGAE